MSSQLNMVRASEHNRELLRAAALDRKQRRSEQLPAKRRFELNWMTFVWSLRSHASRAERRAIRITGLAPPTRPSVALAASHAARVPVHPLATLAAEVPAELPIAGSASARERRFAPVADRQLHGG